MCGVVLTVSRRTARPMRFESDIDIDREQRAIKKFVSRFKGTFKKIQRRLGRCSQ